MDILIDQLDSYYELSVPVEVEHEETSDDADCVLALDVQCSPIGDLERRECDRHGERGVQFQPSTRDSLRRPTASREREVK